MISQEQFRELIETRARSPHSLADAVRHRKRRDYIDDGRGLLIVAADHLARGVLRSGVGTDRQDLLGRLVRSLDHPAVDGIIATADIVEELALLRALDDKLVFGSMNRSGLAGSSWEMDDRFNCYDVRGIEDAKLDGGKMLLRIDMGDPGSNNTIESASVAVRRLARISTVALVEPLPAVRQTGRWMVSGDADAIARAVSMASALGSTSAFTWLKLPAVQDMDLMLGATSLPVLVHTGDPGEYPERAYARWEKALSFPQVRGLVTGRAVLYPPHDNIDEALDVAAHLMGKPVRN